MQRYSQTDVQLGRQTERHSEILLACYITHCIPTCRNRLKHYPGHNGKFVYYVKIKPSQPIVNCSLHSFAFDPILPGGLMLRICSKIAETRNGSTEITETYLDVRTWFHWPCGPRHYVRSIFRIIWIRFHIFIILSMRICVVSLGKITKAPVS